MNHRRLECNGSTMVAQRLGKARIPSAKACCSACGRAFARGEGVCSTLDEDERRDWCASCFEKRDKKALSVWWKRSSQGGSLQQEEEATPQGDLGCLQKVRALISEADEEHAVMMAYLLLLYLERKSVVRQSRAEGGLVFEILHTGESFFLPYPESATISPELVEALQRVLE